MAAKRRKKHKNKISGFVISMCYNEQKSKFWLFTNSSTFNTLKRFFLKSKFNPIEKDRQYIENKDIEIIKCRGISKIFWKYSVFCGHPRWEARWNDGIVEWFQHSNWGEASNLKTRLWFYKLIDNQSTFDINRKFRLSQ
jgi:hypothetical protein